MLTDRAQLTFRLLAGFWLLFSVALLVLGVTGWAADWLQSNTACGRGAHTYAECEPGEIQEIFTIVGGIGVAVGLVELAVLSFIGRGRAVAHA